MGTMGKMKLRWRWMRQQMTVLRRNLNLTRVMIRMMMTKKKRKKVKMMKKTIKIVMIKRSLNQWIERGPDLDASRAGRRQESGPDHARSQDHAPGRAEDRVLVEGRVR